MSFSCPGGVAEETILGYCPIRPWECQLQVLTCFNILILFESSFGKREDSRRGRKRIHEVDGGISIEETWKGKDGAGGQIRLKPEYPTR